MQRIAKSLLAMLLVTAAVSTGCSRQKSLAQRLRQADRVVVTMPGKPVSITISNEEVKSIVQALDTAQKMPGKGLQATLGHTLDFFQGTNHLATVPTSYRIFWIGNTPYEDKSGTLAAFYDGSPF